MCRIEPLLESVEREVVRRESVHARARRKLTQARVVARRQQLRVAGDDIQLPATVEREPSLRALGVGQGFAIGSFVVGIAIYLLLWFFIARKASNVAKWILVVLLALSMLSVLYTLAMSFALTVTTLLGLAMYALEIAAVVFLFRDDAVAWLTHREPAADPATFD